MRDDKGLYAIGSGGTLALGALAALESETKTHAKASGAAKKAINIAIEYNVWCGGTEVKYRNSCFTQSRRVTDLIYNTEAATSYFCRCRGHWSCTSKRLEGCTVPDKQKQSGAM